MCQKMPITAVVTVTTPQDIALVDVKKSIAMYKKLNIPCFGIIENMSTHVCSNCGHTEAIFGLDGGDKLAAEYDLKILARLPLNIAIREACDAGIPVTNVDNENINQLFDDLAKNVLNNLNLLPKDYSAQIGKISVVKE
jgi:ATP-binding protein involved in chromosome partitioning